MLLALVALPTLVVAPLAWVCILVFGVKAVRNARPEVELWSRETMWNPINVLFSPQMLTDAGRRYRRKCFLAVLWFAVPIGVVMAVFMIRAAFAGQLG